MTFRRLPTPERSDDGYSLTEVLITIALMGGIGGTLTLLSYNYWMGEKGWRGPGWARGMRFDPAPDPLYWGRNGVRGVREKGRFDGWQILCRRGRGRTAKGLGGSAGHAGRRGGQPTYT